MFAHNQSRFTLIGGLLLFILALLGIIMLDSRLPNDISSQLIVRMTASGIMLTLLSYGVYKSGVLQYLGSLRVLMLLIVLLTVGVVLFFLWLLSQLLFSYSLYLPIMSTVLFFAGMSAVSFGYFVSQAMSHRIFALAEAAAKVAQGDFSTRLDVRGNDELAYLTRRFNKMASDLQEVEEQKRQLEQSRRNLVAWVSHDLRTPLASMRVMLEALADGIIHDKETETRYIQTTLNEIQHLSRLINDLFEMAKLDVGHTDLELQPIPFAELVSDTMGGMLAKASAKHIHLEGDVDEAVDLVNIAPDKIQRVLKNLLDNAIKYSPEGETVSIHAAYVDTDTLRVEVANSGVQIEAESLPKLFDSFYRGDESRAKNAEERGAGLGLAIARGFVEAHGGKIWAESAAEGTRFIFTLPTRKNGRQIPLQT
jgi:signal transduction histidine kinase